MPKKKAETTEETVTSENKVDIIDSPLSDMDVGETFIASGKGSPCEVGDAAHIPYWEKIHGEKTYGYDTYLIDLVAGSGEIWVCTVRVADGINSGGLIPNVDVFFTVKNTEKMIGRLKRTEDEKKLSKWKRKKNLEEIGF